MAQINTILGKINTPDFSYPKMTQGLIKPPTTNNNWSLGGLVSNLGNFLNKAGNYINQSAQRGNQIIQQGQQAAGLNSNTQNTNQSNPIDYSKMQSIPGQKDQFGNTNAPLKIQTQSQQNTGITKNDNQTMTNDVTKTDFTPTTNPYTAMRETNPYSATAATYPGYIGALGNTPQQYNPQYQQYQEELAKAANNPNIQEAYKNIQNLQNQYANTIAQIAGGQGLTQQTAQGREGVVQNLYANQMNAAQQALANAQAQAGLQQAGYQQAGALAQGAQGLQQQALNAAAGYTAPQLSSYGLGYYQPAQAGTASGGQPIGGGNFGTGPAAAANAESVKYFQNQYDTWLSSYNGAKGIVDQRLVPFLQNSGVNPSKLNEVNSFLRVIANNVSDPRYKQLQDIITELSSSYASILTQPGQNQTNLQTSIAQSLIDSSMNGQGILSVIDQLDKTAQIKMQQLQQTIGQIGNQGETAQTRLGTYVKKDGKWVINK
jgi:hypothetical protein